MYKRLSRHHSREGAFKLMREQLFCILYPALRRISREYDDLTPAEVWHEAMAYVMQLKQMPRPDMMQDELEEMMLEKYRCFDVVDSTIERSEEQARRSTFVVMMTMLYILTTENKNIPEKPYKAYCQMLAEATANHELRESFWKEVYDTENREEQSGHRVEMVNLELEAANNGEDRAQVINDLVDCASEYDENVIKDQLLVLRSLNYQCQNEFVAQEQRLDEILRQKTKSAHEMSYTEHIKGDKHVHQAGSMSFALSQNGDPMELTSKIIELEKKHSRNE